MSQVLPIVRDALHTVWRRKHLWVLGFLVAAGASGSGRVELPVGGVADVPPWVDALMIVAAALGVVLLGLHVIAEGALIEAVRDERRGGAPRLAESWRRGLGTAWRMLGLKLISALSSGAALALAFAPLLAALLDVLPLAVGVLGTLALAIVAAPFAVSVYLATELGARMVVFERRGAIDALRAGLRFLRGRLRFALALFVVDGAAQLALTMVALPLVAVALGLGLAVYALAGMTPAIAVAAALAIPIAAIITGARGTFRSALWTHGFLDERPGAA